MAEIATTDNEHVLPLTMEHRGKLGAIAGKKATIGVRPEYG